MHTKLKDADIRAIVEYSLIVMKIRREVNEVQLKEKVDDKKEEFELKASDRNTTLDSEVNLKLTTLQIGLAEISLFGPQKNIKAELYLGTPRLLVQGRSISEGTKTTAVFNYAFEQADAKFEKIRQLIPSECFVGCQEEIPGLKNNRLPVQQQMLKPADFSTQLTLFISTIDIVNIDEFDKAIEKYIQKECSPETKRYFHGEIVERRLSVQQHNTWQAVGDKAVALLTKDPNGAI